MERGEKSECTYPIVDPEADEDTEGDGKLLKSDQSSSDFGRSTFAVVEGNNHRQATDTHTARLLSMCRYKGERGWANLRDESTSQDLFVPADHRTSLDDDTKNEDAAGDEDAVFA